MESSEERHPALSLATALYACEFDPLFVHHSTGRRMVVCHELKLTMMLPDSPTDQGDLALQQNDRIQVIEHMNNDCK